MDGGSLMEKQAFRSQFLLHLFVRFGRAFAPVATRAEQLKVLEYPFAALGFRIDMVDFQILLREWILANRAIVVVVVLAFELPLLLQQFGFEIFHLLFGRSVVFPFRQVSFGFDFFDVNFAFPQVLESEFFQLRLYQVDAGFMAVDANPTAIAILGRNQRGGAAAKRVYH